MRYTKVIRHLISLSLVLLLAACSSTSLTQTWKDPQAGKSRNFLILGVTKDPGARQLFEGALTEQLVAAGVQAIPSFTLFPNKDEALSKEQIVAAAHENQVDSVIVAYVLDVRQEKETVTTLQSDAGSYRSGYYSGSRNWYNSYASGYTKISTYQNDYTIANVETSLYRLKDEKLLWSSVSETVTLNAGIADIKGLAKSIVQTLKKEGLI